MTDTGGKLGTRAFKKKEHRPWKTNLLESTIQQSQLNGPTTSTFSLDEDFDLNFNFIEDDMSGEKFSQLAAINISPNLELEDAHRDIKYAIRQTLEQQDGLVQQLHDKSVLSLGGFFQPQNLGPQADSQSGRQINSLLTDLQKKKEKLSSLTSNLKVSEALEKAEQASISKQAEERARQAAENRMRQAIEQANLAAEQFHIAMEQANQAAAAHKQEENARKIAEEQAKEAKIRAQNADTALQNERLARIAAEEKTQQALLDAEQALIYKQQLQFTSEQVAKLEKVNEQYIQLQAEFTRTKQENDANASKAITLEQKLQEITSKFNNDSQKIAELTAQVSKLKTIIETEQGLRKISERKMQESISRAEQAEKAKTLAEQQCKEIDERAKRAVAHASRTVMHLLNAPMNADLGLQNPSNPEKQQPNTEQEEPDYSF